MRTPGASAPPFAPPAPGDADHVAAAECALSVLRAVLSGYGIADHDMVDAQRTVRAALHGFSVLEAAGGFGLPRELDATYSLYVSTSDAGLAATRLQPSGS